MCIGCTCKWNKQDGRKKNFLALSCRWNDVGEIYGGGEKGRWTKIKDGRKTKCCEMVETSSSTMSAPVYQSALQGRVKQSLLEAWTGPECCRGLRLPPFVTVGTWTWERYQLYALLISVRGWVDLRAIVRPEELSQWTLMAEESRISRALNFYINAISLSYRCSKIFKSVAFQEDLSAISLNYGMNWVLSLKCQLKSLLDVSGYLWIELGGKWGLLQN